MTEAQAIEMAAALQAQVGDLDEIHICQGDGDTYFLMVPSADGWRKVAEPVLQAA